MKKKILLVEAVVTKVTLKLHRLYVTLKTMPLKTLGFLVLSMLRLMSGLSLLYFIYLLFLH